jgi:hemolysin III
MAKCWRVREPFCGWSHMLGVALSIAALLSLVYLAQDRIWHLLGFVVYGVTLITLYVASTLYHSLPATVHQQERLLVFDQVAIYALIAGTYTPLCLVPLRGTVGWWLLTVIWGIALVGSALRIAWKAAPHWLPLPVYVLMSWLCCVSVWGPLTQALPPAALHWLFAGGIIYTLGAVLLASKRPRLWPGVFSFHELWHVFVLAGSGCHFGMMLCFVAPG